MLLEKLEEANSQLKATMTGELKYLFVGIGWWCYVLWTVRKLKSLNAICFCSENSTCCLYICEFAVSSWIVLHLCRKPAAGPGWAESAVGEVSGPNTCKGYCSKLVLSLSKKTVYVLKKYFFDTGCSFCGVHATQCSAFIELWYLALLCIPESLVLARCLQIATKYYLILEAPVLLVREYAAIMFCVLLHAVLHQVCG